MFGLSFFNRSDVFPKRGFHSFTLFVGRLYKCFSIGVQSHIVTHSQYKAYPQGIQDLHPICEEPQED